MPTSTYAHAIAHACTAEFKTVKREVNVDK